MLAGQDDLQAGFGERGDVKKPQFALMFEQSVIDGSKILYVVYNCTFDVSAISLSSIEESVEETNLEIPITVSQGENGYFYYAVNDKEVVGGNTTMITNWFTQVQEPYTGEGA